MKVQEFYSRYSDVAKTVQNNIFNYGKMSAPEKAESSVESQKAVNKLFSDQILSDWLGKSVDVSA